MEAADRIRNKVLGDIRAACRTVSQERKAQIEAQYVQLSHAESPRPVVDGILVEEFIQKHESVHGTTKVVQSYSQVPDAVRTFLNEHDLPTKMVMSSTKFMAGFDWPGDWRITHRKAQKTDVVGITGAMCAIAETGTLVVASSPQVSSTHLFLPDNHIAIIDAGQVVRHLDDALRLLTEDILRQARGIHMITGPSKTADVEQTIQYGAHGPRRLHVIIVISAN